MPQLRRPLGGNRVVLEPIGRRDRSHQLLLPHPPAPISAPAIERDPPGHTHQPAAESIAVAQLCEPAMGAGEGLLGGVLRVLVLPEDAVGHPERQRRRICEPGLELTVRL